MAWRYRSALRFYCSYDFTTPRVPIQDLVRMLRTDSRLASRIPNKKNKIKIYEAGVPGARLPSSPFIGVFVFLCSYARVYVHEF